ncbi:tyrosine-protein phosphatase non-receptor type 6 [Phlyctema vagabunda]|uniref:Tyrosine-protein phosphatase non-receptor type 6 n=1 Tax=Phlyctema vagabunda TaxID=108571 RepID=A0ABR4PH42_9HELO
MSGSGPKPDHAFLAPGQKTRKRDFNSFCAELQTTVNNALPSTSKNYKKVAVLALRWSNDKMGVESTERDLLAVFKNNYGFAVENYVLDAKLSTWQVQRALVAQVFSFQDKWQGPDSLCIYVYSGHGEFGPPVAPRQYDIFGDIQNKQTKVRWASIESLIQAQSGDVLYIFDSCYASHLSRTDGPELLAAANWASQASSHVTTSFTKILTDTLRKLNGDPSSAADIFAMMHRDDHKSHLGEVPIHVPRPNKPSIVLQKLVGSHGPTPAKRQQISRLNSSQSTIQTRVLISVLVDEDPGKLDLEKWKNWVTNNIPASVDPSEITIEAQFTTDSSLVFVALPLAIWTMLPDDEAYSFISYIKGGNLLTPTAGPIPGTLSDRTLPSGRENQRPGRENQPSGLQESGSGSRK